MRVEKIGGAILYNGEAIDVMRGMDDCSIDSIVTDPPYGLSDHGNDDVLNCLRSWVNGEEYKPSKKGFMGRSWDAWVPGPEVWRECLRVLKPGGHLLAFAGTRSMDLMCMAVRLAGFELRDSIGYAHDDDGGAPLIAWVYGQGFPKSHNVSNGIDKAKGTYIPGEVSPNSRNSGESPSGCFNETIQLKRLPNPQSTEAVRWAGWGTALKPAWEPIIVARKPLVGTVAVNVLRYSTGAMNIDGCRVEPTGERLGGGGEKKATFANKDGWGRPWMNDAEKVSTHALKVLENVDRASSLGRWPANVIHDGSEEVVSLFPETESASSSMRGVRHGNIYGGGKGLSGPDSMRGHDDAGGSSARFFYCAKASKADREEGLEGFIEKAFGVNLDTQGRTYNSRCAVCGKKFIGPEDRICQCESPVTDNTAFKSRNNHPTVKPTALMRYLVRLVTPPGGRVHDPFMGSGSTGKAAILEGFQFSGSEIDTECGYFDISVARIAWAANIDLSSLADKYQLLDKKEEPKKEAIQGVLF